MPESILGKVILEVAGGAATGGGGSPSSTGAGGVGSRESRKNNEQLGMLRKSMNTMAKGVLAQPKWFGKAMKGAGVSMGVAGILKQSQIFTGVLGAMFQILGAMIDVMLAPLIKPVLMPMVKGMAKLIPWLAKGSKWVVGAFAKIFEYLGKFFKFVWNVIKNPIKWYIKFIKAYLGFWLKALLWVWNNTLGRVFGKKWSAGGGDKTGWSDCLGENESKADAVITAAGKLVAPPAAGGDESKEDGGMLTKVKNMAYNILNATNVPKTPADPSKTPGLHIPEWEGNREHQYGGRHNKPSEAHKQYLLDLEKFQENLGKTNDVWECYHEEVLKATGKAANMSNLIDQKYLEARFQKGDQAVEMIRNDRVRENFSSARQMKWEYEQGDEYFGHAGSASPIRYADRAEINSKYVGAMAGETTIAHGNVVIIKNTSDFAYVDE